jgi:general stress protein YciG
MRTLTPTLQKHLSVIGKKGGAKTSDAKARAAAENGKKGGRPKKVIAPEPAL